ncbi:MAG: class IV adenylate cyclase [Chloroflexota bacterium]
MPNNTETEVKLYVPHLEWVQVQLERVEAALTAPRVYERNVRYENAEKSLTSSGVVVRLRQDTRARLTYKEGSSAQGGITSRTEIEVEVSDFDSMQTILGKLGYHPHLVYEKYRTTYELDGAEIVLDEMPYGNFVEIEGEAAAIESLIKKLSLQDTPRLAGSYTTLFDRVKTRLGLSFDHLTFENFKGIDVPESAFQVG